MSETVSGNGSTADAAAAPVTYDGVSEPSRRPTMEDFARISSMEERYRLHKKRREDREKADPRVQVVNGQNMIEYHRKLEVEAEKLIDLMLRPFEPKEFWGADLSLRLQLFRHNNDSVVRNHSRESRESANIGAAAQADLAIMRKGREDRERAAAFDVQRTLRESNLEDVRSTGQSVPHVVPLVQPKGQ